MKPRQVCQLRFARQCERPAGLPIARPRGKKAAGLRYERAIASALPAAVHGQWFEFQDANGPGHCQTDLLLETPVGWAILEAKYTWTQTGHWQVERLYRPVVEMAWRAPAFGLVICKVLTGEVARGDVCRSLPEALHRAAAGKRTVLHWLGAGSLEPCQRSSASSHLVSPIAEL